MSARRGAAAAERWRKVRTLFDAAVELAPEERRRYLDEACGGEEEDLRRAVEKMLAADVAATSFLEQTAVAEVADLISEPAKILPAGKSFGHYEIVEKIGAGGMGEVYLARDQKLDRSVALKILNAQFAAHESNLNRFVHEAKAASALNHPNILVIHEIGAADATDYIVSEYVEGVTLREHFKVSPISLSEILDIAVQIAGALAAAHAARIIHRDIKPENIMLRPDGYVKVLDFGLAKLIEPPTSGFETETAGRNQTARGVILGTINYMSPEQARGAPVDERTDVFSFGAVLYEMIAGRTPFAGDSTAETFANLINREPPPLRRFAPSAPDELQKIVGKMLRKKQSRRYQTMTDAHADLKHLRETLNFDAHFQKTHSPAASLKAKPFKAATGASIFSTEAERGAFARRPALQKYLLAVAGAVLLLAAIVGFRYFEVRRASDKPIESIAVLPFENENGGTDAEYLSDGITETLINSLSQIPKLNVKARSSVFRYKGRDAEIRKIGSELNVEAILSGRVVQHGDDLTLYLSLEDVQTGNRIWGERYDKKLNDLAAWQTEIAGDVSSRLRMKLSGDDEQRLAKQYTANTEAYRLYLQGRYYWNKRTGADLQKADEYFQQAVALDPNYALAYTGIADTFTLLPNYIGISPHETAPKARAAALKALSLDERLAEAHAALGLILTEYDYDFVAAEREYRRAVELNPNYAAAHQFYGELLSHLGRHEEAFAEMNRALEIDPLSLVVNRTYGGVLYQARQYERAVAQLKKTIEMDAGFAAAHATLSVAYNLQGEYAAGNEEYAKFQELTGKPDRAALLRETFARGGRAAVLRALVEEPQPDYLPSYIAATFYAELGEKDRAFKKLHESYEKREYNIVLLKVDPRLDPLRADERFAELLKLANFGS